MINDKCVQILGSSSELGEHWEIAPQKDDHFALLLIRGFENIKNPYGEILNLLATSGPENHGAFYQDDIINKCMTFDRTKF